MRRIAWTLPSLFLLACPGDDSGPGDTGASTSGSTGAAPTGSLDGSGTTEGPADGSGSSGTPPATTTATDTGEPTGGGSTGGGLDGVVLVNDGWTPTEAIEFQTWANQQDCWASVFTADAADYPFDIVGARVAIGGGGDVVTFSAAVWTVDNQGTPDTELATTTFDVDGAIMDLTEVDLSGLGLATIDGGDFAIVMCHTEHMGSPSIAIDADGSVDAARNWVFQQAMGVWVPSPDFFGIDGDFILRAIIQPQG